MLQAIEDYIHNTKEASLEELYEFLRIPSISTDSRYKDDIDRCAQFLKGYLDGIGLEKTTIYETKGHPIVYGEWCGAPDKPTVLLYGHYDVQPPDPLELCQSPPFQPECRDGQIYARGVSDDKGQVFCHLKSIQAFLSEHGELPVNIKILIEGEEEIGSPNLTPFVEAHTDLLKADTVLISDMPMFAEDRPSLCLSLRGLVYMELEAVGANQDLHSGQHGGPVPNPIHALANLITCLKDSDGRVMIPGFYDEVASVPPTIQKQLQEGLFDVDGYKTQLGLTTLVGEKGFSTCEQQWFRPTLDCNGIIGGYTGEGAKTVIPSKASAKISMRLVAHQDPDEIVSAFMTYVKEQCPPGITLSVSAHSTAHPAMVDADQTAVKAAQQAIKNIYGKDPLFLGEGGTIPVVSEFERLLGIQSVLMGLNLPNDGIHAPNEHFSVKNFYNGILTSAHFWNEYARSY